MFEDSRKWVQCLILFFIAVFSVCLSGVIAAVVIKAAGVPPEAMNTELKWMELTQLIVSVVTFLFGAYLSAMLLSRHPLDYLLCHRAGGFMPYLLAIVAIITVQPLVDWTSVVNMRMELPEALQSMEDEADNLTKAFMQDQSAAGILKSLCLMALVPAICEEFFFRGAVLSLCRRIFKSVHWAVWICAFIFSFIHFQFSGFLPRMLLGAVLGYLAVRTGSIWVPITAHFVNNAMSVAAFSVLPEEAATSDLQSLVGSGWAYYLLLIAGTLIFLACMLLIRFRGRLRRKG